MTLAKKIHLIDNDGFTNQTDIIHVGINVKNKGTAVNIVLLS